ncbi:MAG: cyclase family protein [Acidisphaera sp.]|nr:cyclase family protein [Acidisphaera sp.]
MAKRWVKRPDGSNWGEYGENDQLGRLNLITPDCVRAAAREIVEGRTFCLSMPLDKPGGNLLSPSRYPPVIRPTVRNGRVRMNYRVADDIPGAPDLICDDAAVLHTQYSTHWDAFSHVGFMFDADDDGIPEPRYYNGFRGGEDIVGPADPGEAGSVGVFEAKTTSIVRALGIDGMAATCVQGRGVMVDLHAQFGDRRVAVGYDMLMEVMRADRVQVEPGDLVCLHTGYADFLLRNTGRLDAAAVHNACASLDGRDQKLLDWITDSGLAVLIADNFAVECYPAEHRTCCAAAPLHEHCLFKLGIHLGELWHLTPLARWLRAAGRNRFMLTAPPLRLPGATGSPATPVATV